MANNDTDVTVDIGASGSYKSVLSSAISDFSNFWKSASGGGDAKTAASNMDNLASKMGISNKALLGVGVAGAVVAAGVAAVGVSAIKAASNFQEMTTTLVTGAGESEKNLGMVRSGILDISDATGESAANLVNGMFMIESAGYHGATGLTVLKAAAEGAKVGNADLGTVSDATTTIMKNFSSATPTEAVNTLIATVANGKTHMEDLANSMSKILPVSSAAGLGLNDVMGAMATLTGEGMTARLSATDLSTAIKNIAAPTPAVVKAMNDVGLNTTQVAQEMQKSLPGAMKEITDAVGKKFPEGSIQYLAAIKGITGSSAAMNAVLGISGKHISDFQSNVKAVSDQVKEGGKSIVGWTDVQKDENTKMDEAKASIQNAKIALGEGLLPMVTAITKAIGDVVRPISEWIAGHQKIAAIILGSIGIFGALAVAVAVVTAAVGALNIAALPWIAAAMAVGAAAYFIIQNWSKIEPSLRPVIKIFRDDLLPVLKEIAKFVVGQLKAAWDELVKSFEKIEKALEPYKKQLEDLAKIIGVVLVAAIAVAIAPFVIMIATIIAVITVGARLIGWIAEAAAAFIKFAAGLISTVVSAISSVIGWFTRLPSDIMHAIGDFGSLLLGAGKDLMNGLIKGIENGADDVMNTVKGIGDKAVSALKGVLKIFSPSQVFADIGSNIGAGLVQGIQGTSTSVTAATTNLGTAAIVGGQTAIATAPSITSSTNNVNNSSAQSINIQNLQLVMPNGATMQTFMASMNQDSLNLSKGLTPTQGAY